MDVSVLLLISLWLWIVYDAATAVRQGNRLHSCGRKRYEHMGRLGQILRGSRK